MGWLEDVTGAIYTGTDYVLGGALPDFGAGSAIPAGTTDNIVGTVQRAVQDYSRQAAFGDWVHRETNPDDSMYRLAGTVPTLQLSPYVYSPEAGFTPNTRSVLDAPAATVDVVGDALRNVGGAVRETVDKALEGLGFDLNTVFLVGGAAAALLLLRE